MPDAIAELGLDTAPFSKALADVNAEMADLLIESNKLNAEIALLERKIFNAGTATKEQTKNLREMKAVAEDFGEQIKQAKEQQKSFNAAVNDATPAVNSLGISMRSLISFLGAGVGIRGLYALLSDFRKAQEDSDKLDESIRNLGTSEGAPEYKTLDVLQKRLGDINKEIEKLSEEKGPVASILEFFRQGFEDFSAEGPDDTVAAKREAQAKKLFEERKKAQDDISAKTKEQNDILEMRLKHEDYEVELKKNELHYDELIQKARDAQNDALVTQLTNQKALNEELIKQKNLESQTRTTSGIASDQAKEAIGSLLGDQKNQEKIDDREADRKQSDLDFFHEEERKSGERALAYKAKQDKEESDFFHKQEHEMGLRALRFAEEQQKKEQRQREQQNAIRDQLTVSGVRRQDGGNAASREAVAQHFDKRIQDAIRDGDPETERLLRQQQNEALAGLDTHQALETPAQHRADVRESRRETRNEAHASERNADLDDRIARGARGSEHSRIEERRRQNQRDAERAKNQDAARHAAKPDTSKGYGPTDRQYLKSIADALTTKD